MRRCYVLSLVLVAASAACGKGQKNASSRSAVVENPNVAIDAEVKSDAGGVLTAIVKGLHPNAQLVKASASQPRIAGTRIEFAPTSFDVDFEVVLQEARGIAAQSTLQKLGFEPDFYLQGVGPAAVVSWTYDEDALHPYTLTISVPKVTGLKDGKNLAIFFIKNIANSDNASLGLLSGDKLTVDGDFVTFESQAYGLFQAAYLSKDAGEGKQVTTAEKLSDVGAGAGPRQPEDFTILAPTDALSAKSPRIGWEPSHLADAYTLALDASDAKCGSPYKIYAGLKTTSQVLDAAVNGDNFVCVKAKNAAGETNAMNNGFRFKADASGPQRPAKPATGTGPYTANIELTFSWAAVQDVGAAGFSHWTLEVGTTAGGADVFTGSVVDETSHSVIAEGGKTYYARVRAVDKVGNVSEWSPNSSAVTVDTKPPGNLTGFAAEPGSATGEIALVLAIDTANAFKYRKISVYRATGTTAPGCAGTPVKTIEKDFEDMTLFDQATVPGETYSYRVCITDVSGRVVLANTGTVTAPN